MLASIWSPIRPPLAGFGSGCTSAKTLVLPQPHFSCRTFWKGNNVLWQKKSRRQRFIHVQNVRKTHRINSSEQSRPAGEGLRSVSPSKFTLRLLSARWRRRRARCWWQQGTHLALRIHSHWNEPHSDRKGELSPFQTAYTTHVVGFYTCGERVCVFGVRFTWPASFLLQRLKACGKRVRVFCPTVAAQRTFPRFNESALIRECFSRHRSCCFMMDDTSMQPPF